MKIVIFLVRTIALLFIAVAFLAAWAGWNASSDDGLACALGMFFFLMLGAGLLGATLDIEEGGSGLSRKDWRDIRKELKRQKMEAGYSA